jgi:hypothetical protein
MSKIHGSSNVPLSGVDSGQVQPRPQAAGVPGSGKSFASIATPPMNDLKYMVLKTNIKNISLENFKIRASYSNHIFIESPKLMKVIYDLCSCRDLQTWRRIQRQMHDNDDTPPRGGTPVALPGPLPASIAFPMKLACGGGR